MTLCYCTILTTDRQKQGRKMRNFCADTIDKLNKITYYISKIRWTGLR